jgi:transcriptional antiterminator NusG
MRQEEVKMEEKKKATARIKLSSFPDLPGGDTADFSRDAASIEKNEAERVAERVLRQDEVGEDVSLISKSLDSQSSEGEGNQLDEDAISDVPKWYVAHTYSGYENQVKISLDKVRENRHMENRILEVRIPMEEETETRNGKTKTVSRKMVPGYVLILMIMDDETWYVVRNTRGVTGFVGPGSKPVALSEEEVAKLEGRDLKSPASIGFKEGDSVKVVAGIWKDTLGTVTKVDAEKRSVTISIELFGRETPVEIPCTEVRKAE